MAETAVVATTNSPTATNGTDTTQQNGTPQEAARFENPFDAIAYLLMVMRESLEGKRDDNEYPRYVRIVRPASDTSTDGSWIEYISGATSIGAQGLTYIMARFIDWSLYGKSMMIGIDSLIALLEVALETIGTASNEDFLKAIEKSFTPPSEEDTTPLVNMSNAGGNLQSQWAADAQEYLKYIPSPEDLDRIGYELYRLSRVIYHGVPGDNNTTVQRMDIVNSGKLRMLAWAYGHSWNVYYPHENGDKEFSTKHLGRNAGFPDSRITTSAESEIKYENSGITLLKVGTGDVVPDGNNDGLNSDVYEAQKLLVDLEFLSNEVEVTKGGNPLDTVRYKKAIAWFQQDNGLPITKVLDNDTMNRLFNLDHAGKNIKRARKKHGPEPIDIDIPLGGYFDLINPNADQYQGTEELYEVPKPGYRYYMIGKKFSELPTDTKAGVIVPNTNSPWKLGTNEDFPGAKGLMVDGFVGIESRRLTALADPNKSMYDGDVFSEGQASDGRFFFAARENEPWRPGRSGTPKDNRLWSKTPPKDGISRMYQDVDLSPDVLENFKTMSGIKPAESILKIQASAMFRSLFTDRTKSRSTNIFDILKTGLSDQGRLLLELRAGAKENSTTLDTTQVTVGSKGDDPNDFTKFWGPSRKVTDLMIKEHKLRNKYPTMRHIDQYNTWRQIFSTEVYMTKAQVDALAAGSKFTLRVFLDGMHISGWDIDAYFDDVKLRWDYIPVKV